MKPCPSNKRLIAWICAGALNDHRRSGLEKHLQSCPGCRAYHLQMSNLTVRIEEQSALPQSKLPEGFHERIVRKIADSRAPRAGLLGAIEHCWRDGRRETVIGVSLGLTILIFTFVVLQHQAVRSRPGLIVRIEPPAAKERPPTLASYRAAAESSSEALDELLARENKTFSFGQTYKVSSQMRLALEN